MIKNYLAIAIRNIRQNPLYSFINIFSLTIGLAACMVIYLFIADEKSFDGFHFNSPVIYRLNEIQNFPGTNEQHVALSMPGMGPNILKDFPEVENYTRYMSRNKPLIINGEDRFLLESLAFVDSTFLEIFDFELLHGNRESCLDNPYSILITEETALKYFSSPDEALDKALTYGEDEYKITGILKNTPENTHLQFDALISMTTVTRENPEFNDRWGSNFLNTYFIVNDNSDISALEEKFPAFMSRHMDNPDINDYYKLYLQPLKDVHLSSMEVEHDYNNYRKFNGTYLDLFYIIGAFILLIACVNFMNLTTARSSHRWKEIGVRKTIGAKRWQLFGQFIFESMILAFMALVIALLIDLMAIPLLNTLIGRKLMFIDLFSNAGNLTIVLAGTLVLGLLTGIYPSLYMTSFNLARVLKGGSKTEGKSLFRSGLVVVQFGLSLAMIVSTLIVIQQLSFMKNKDIGFDKDQIILVDLNREANQKYETLKQELLRDPNIEGVTASGQRLGNNFHQWGFKVKSDTGVFNITPSNVFADYDYLTVYGMELVKGRNFSKEHGTDNNLAFIVNESLAKELGIEDIIGTPVGHSNYHNDSLGTIIGVVKDFNFNSLHYKINTLAISLHMDWGFDEMSVKINGKNKEQAIAHIKKIWDENISSFPFDYSFLDEHFEVLYRSDQQMGTVVTIIASLAILISCMGLFGLAAIITEKKTKEIGIRKVIGATETQITVLLSRNFAWLILLSFVLISPVTYLLLEQWLGGFAFRIDINPLLFLLGGFIALTIALLTISYHTLRSARANPVKSLRYE